MRDKQNTIKNALSEGWYGGKNQDHSVASDRGSVEQQVNAFLQERSFAPDEVRIQFVSSIWNAGGGGGSTAAPDIEYEYEAYVTHPA